MKIEHCRKRENLWRKHGVDKMLILTEESLPRYEVERGKDGQYRMVKKVQKHETGVRNVNSCSIQQCRPQCYSKWQINKSFCILPHSFTATPLVAMLHWARIMAIPSLCSYPPGWYSQAQNCVTPLSKTAQCAISPIAGPCSFANVAAYCELVKQSRSLG